MSKDLHSGEKNASARKFGEYLKRSFASDFVAGLSVAVLAVPQGMAFAHLARLPPMHGVYAAMFGGLVSSLFSSCELLIAGPTNSISLLLLSCTFDVPREKLLDAVLLITFLVGVLQCTFGIARLGALLRYVSHSVVVGFASGAALLIIARQLPALFGTSRIPEARFFPLIFETGKEIFSGNINWPSLAIGLAVMALIISCNKIERRFPATLVGVVGAALLVKALGAEKLSLAVIRESAKSVSLLPNPYFPNFTLAEAESHLGDALAIALLGLVQTASISRSLAARQQTRIRASRDFLTQGLMNTVCSFLQGFAGCGSFVRSALNLSSGARTRISGILAALFTPLVAWALSPLFSYIPEAALAAIITVAAFTMIDWEHIRISFTATPGSKAVLITTFLATLIFRVQFGIFLGVLLSLAIFIRLSSEVNITRWIPQREGDFKEVDLSPPFPADRPLVINVEGELFFGAVEDFEDKLNVVADHARGVVILRLRRVRAMGSTAVDAIQRFHRRLAERGVKLLVCGLEKELYRLFLRSGLSNEIGKENIFEAGDLLLESTKRALKRSEEIILRLPGSEIKNWKENSEN